MAIPSELESALLSFGNSEIQARNTPIFFSDELRIERIGADAQLDKVLTWWRTPIWPPLEMRREPKPECAFCEVLKSAERVLNFYDYIGSENVPSGHAIIVNNKWIFPNHYLIVPAEQAPHIVTQEKINLLCRLAEYLPSFMLYVTSRGLGVPQHFHGHIVQSKYIPPLARADFASQHFVTIWNHGTIKISEIQSYPKRHILNAEKENFIAGWAITGQDGYIAKIIFQVAKICSEVIAPNIDRNVLQTDIFWGPQQSISGDSRLRTVLVFPRRSDRGKFRDRLGATEFVGLFAFNEPRYFWYTVDEAVTDLRETGLPWEYPEREHISNRIKQLSISG